VLLTLIFILPRVLISFLPCVLPVQIRMKGPGFLSPFFFTARDVSFSYKGEGTDHLLLRCSALRFRISLSQLLLFRLRFRSFSLADPYLEYENHVESFRKTRLLPARHRIQIDSLNIENGEVYVVDYTLPGPYRLRIRNIHLHGGTVDLATSAGLLLQIRRGRAELGGGIILAHRTGRTGTLLLKNVDWNSVIGLEHIPFLPGTEFSLSVRHHTISDDEVKVQGRLHLLGSGDESSEVEMSGIPFAFVIRWDDYRMTMDLGIQKMIDQILTHAKPGLIQAGLLYVGKGIFDRFKKSAEG
jgi:hypothetical protein